MPKTQPWLTGAASQRGTGHVKLDLPNQDAFKVKSSSDGNIIAAVVSDGAGSAPKSQHGSSLCVEIMVDVLLFIGEQHPDQLRAAASGDLKAQKSIQDSVANGLQQVRTQLEAKEGPLQEYHHTFTGAVLTPAGGFLAQIGDSPGLVANYAVRGGGSVDFFAQTVIHLPEKGEYANETCFVTQSDWLKNLHLAPIPRGVALLLMSDGTGELAISRGSVFRPFIAVLMSRLLQATSSEDRDKIIREGLADPRADEITADDKTLVVICHSDWQRLANLKVVETVADKEPVKVPSALPPHPVGTVQKSPQFSLQILIATALVTLLLGFFAGYIVRPIPQKGGQISEAPSKPKENSQGDALPPAKVQIPPPSNPKQAVISDGVPPVTSIGAATNQSPENNPVKKNNVDQ